MAEQGMNTADKAIVRMIGKRIGSSLRTMRGKGLVRLRDGAGAHNLWSLAL
jgi:hypothetical protein